MGECGLDYFRDHAPRDVQARVFGAQIDLANELRLPLVIHTRAADDDTFRMLERAEVPVVLHCFSSVGRLDDAIARDYHCSFAGNVAYPSAGPLREAAALVPAERILAETDSPYLAPPPHRGRPNQPAHVAVTLGVLARERGVALLRAGRPDRPKRRPPVRAVTAQISLARLREYGISPDRDLGQNFLIDSNVLDVAGRLMPVTAEDVVVEVGAGLGVLTAWLAERVALVHAIEIDRRLEPALAATLAGVTNVRLAFADALDLDLAALDPRPGVMVANLPYGVATPVLIRALPAVDRFCVMVQREIGERLFAQPGSKAYGAVSVLVQLACERIGGRAVSRHVFVPQPKVDSMLVAFRRRPEFVFGTEWEWTGRVVHGAFAHRRKTLQNSLRLAGLPAPPADIAELRAEQLTPERLGQLAQELSE